MPLVTVLGAETIDSLVHFCFTFSFNKVTGKSNTCWLCITKTMSGSSSTGVGDKFSDEEEAPRWSEEAPEVSPFCCVHCLH